ncbi:MAG: carboxylating nicotinate-nucleotide diphosphorylase [Cyanobacteria bacterium P01_C01_bin.89]
MDEVWGIRQDLERWLAEDIGRGDRSTEAIASLASGRLKMQWVAKAPGVVAGLPFAGEVFRLLDSDSEWICELEEGDRCIPGQVIAQGAGSASALLTGERTALNLVMGLSGIATIARQYADAIADLPVQLVDTRKTTPGLRNLEKYASRVGGARNHRMGLDDAVMLKDNHIAAAGGIVRAVAAARERVPFTLSIEVETESLAQVKEALGAGADIIMLDNMSLDEMREAVTLIRRDGPRVKVEASGNITLETIRGVAETGVDFISTSAPITRSPWLDISMRIL